MVIPHRIHRGVLIMYFENRLIEKLRERADVVVLDLNGLLIDDE